MALALAYMVVAEGVALRRVDKGLEEVLYSVVVAAEGFGTRLQQGGLQNMQARGVLVRHLAPELPGRFRPVAVAQVGFLPALALAAN